jgi:hypothetical protein
MNRLTIALSLLIAVQSAFSAERYFPQGSLADSKENDAFRHEHFVKIFHEFNEPSFLTLVEKGAAKDKRMFRFTWLRSFDRPICITLIADGRMTLTSKALDGKGRQEPRKLVAPVPVAVTGADFDQFLKLIDDADFWQMVPTESNADNHWCWSGNDKTWFRAHHSGKDGATWTLEYCDENCYSFAERWSPTSTSAFRKACLFLVKLAGFENEKVY